MEKALPWLRRALFLLQFASEEVAAIDANETGTDDKIAKWVGWFAEALEAFIKGRDIPLPIGLFSKDQIDELAAAEASTATTQPLV